MREANLYLAYLCNLTESTASLTPHPPEVVLVDPLDMSCNSRLQCPPCRPSVRRLSVLHRMPFRPPPVALLSKPSRRINYACLMYYMSYTAPLRSGCGRRLRF
jgi:hypothetical protein